MNTTKSFIAGAVIAATLVASGCGHPDVSPLAYEYATTLFFITNQKLDDRLPKVQRQIDEAVASGELTSTDTQALQKIIDKASSGDWKQANRECRALMEAQLKPAE